MACGLQRVAEGGLRYPASRCNTVSIRITTDQNHFGCLKKSTDSIKHINFITAHSYPRCSNTHTAHTERRPLQSHAVDLSVSFRRVRTIRLQITHRARLSQNKRLVGKANAMRWINYECCNGQWTHATSHEITMQQKHKALASHGFSSQWCQSAGQHYAVLRVLWRTILASRCVNLQDIQHYAVLRVLWRTIWHPDVSICRTYSTARFFEYYDAQFWHPDVLICRTYSTARFCEYYDAQFWHPDVSICRTYMVTMICEDSDAHLSYNPEIYFHVCIRLFYLFTIRLYVSQTNRVFFRAPLLYCHQFPNSLECAERRTALSTV